VFQGQTYASLRSARRGIEPLPDIMREQRIS